MSGCPRMSRQTISRSEGGPPSFNNARAGKRPAVTHWPAEETRYDGWPGRGIKSVRLVSPTPRQTAQTGKKSGGGVSTDTHAACVTRRSGHRFQELGCLEPSHAIDSASRPGGRLGLGTGLSVPGQAPRLVPVPALAAGRLLRVRVRVRRRLSLRAEAPLRPAPAAARPPPGARFCRIPGLVTSLDSRLGS